MKLLFAAATTVLVAALPAAAAAQSGHTGHQGGRVAGSPAAMTHGIVKRVDNAAGSVTIAHEPLANLGMPAMTMSFPVRDRAWLAGLKEGARIRFVAESVKGELVVVAFEPVK